ncbi:MAG: late competence development ComFB family protein [Epulopiscium sp.]|nr:late competence development ComFB family protein [Candidatus Epulonipiscium sp.]
MVKNYMEQIVDELLPVVMEEYPDLYKCKACLADVKAITLNHLKPRYVATEKGEIYVKIDNISLQSKANILKEITKAAEIVRHNPRNQGDTEIKEEIL